MNNETLERLRLPGAWVLVGAVGASMLSGLIRLIAGSVYPGSFTGAMGGASGSFFGLHVPLLLAAAAALVLTSERTRQAASPIVLIGMIMSAVGLLFAAINLITEFVGAADAGNIGMGFAGFVSTLGSAAVLGIVGFALLKVFGDPTLVPRPAPQQQYQYPPQQYPPATGAQQSFAQPAYPVQDAGFPAPADPAQTGSGIQQGYDASQQYGQQYGTGAQQGYAQYGQQADASGQQQAYDASQQYGQQYAADAAQQQYGTGAQQGYAQQGYDASQQYGQQADAAAQQAEYGQAYDPAQYAPQSTEQMPVVGEQAAQDAIQYGWYQGADQARPAQDAQSEGKVDPFFNSGENNGTDAPGQGGGSYGGQYGSGAGYGSDQQGQGGTGGQQGWYGSEDKR
ncbi:hypothetical protein [Nocardiopsis tropica]|uniref:hypothetical protein n=1 Tax=Nocardiopsis tropica TaxID=109330 RepID=UPI0031DC5200